MEPTLVTLIFILILFVIIAGVLFNRISVVQAILGLVALLIFVWFLSATNVGHL